MSNCHNWTTAIIHAAQWGRTGRRLHQGEGKGGHEGQRTPILDSSEPEPLSTSEASQPIQPEFPNPRANLLEFHRLGALLVRARAHVQVESLFNTMRFLPGRWETRYTGELR